MSCVRHHVHADPIALYKLYEIGMQNLHICVNDLNVSMSINLFSDQTPLLHITKLFREQTEHLQTLHVHWGDVIFAVNSAQFAPGDRQVS